MVQLQVSPGAMPPFVAPGDYVPILTTMAGVGSAMCIPAGMVTRGGRVATALMAGHPMSALAERSFAGRALPADGATGAAGSTAHPVFNLSKLSAPIGISEHGMRAFSIVWYFFSCC